MALWTMRAETSPPTQDARELEVADVVPLDRDLVHGELDKARGRTCGDRRGLESGKDADQVAAVTAQRVEADGVDPVGDYVNVRGQRGNGRKDRRAWRWPEAARPHVDVGLSGWDLDAEATKSRFPGDHEDSRVTVQRRNEMCLLVLGGHDGQAGHVEHERLVVCAGTHIDDVSSVGRIDRGLDAVQVGATA